MEIIEIMELTQEEKKLILNRRKEIEEKRLHNEKLARAEANFREALKELFDAGASIRIPMIEGKFFPKYEKLYRGSFESLLVTGYKEI